MTNALTKTNRSFFDDLNKMLIGFDPLSYNYASDNNYPRYNVVETDRGYLLEISVVGLDKDDIEVKFKSGKLSIAGSHKPRPEGVKFVHKGISEKAFQRTFTIDSAFSVGNIELTNGLLIIEINKEPEDEYLLEIK